ncbi:MULTISPECIES: hypothetical protein [unclassified Streptomyces]|uniref:hypothetical protein n=1 Tax=unclassified Streptomyces TaxID=2593676 RepID=UPI003BB7F326
MSDNTTKPDVEPEAVEDDAPPSRIAGAVVALILAAAAVMIVRAVVTAFPYVAYFVAGVIVTVVAQRSVAWARKRRGDDDAEPEEQASPDVGEALRTLGAGGNSVLLTALRKQLGAADTKTVRKLLKAEKVRVRSGVRTPTGNGPGVHHEDIPPAPPEPNGEHGDGCCCRSANNTNANNDQEDPSQKGLSVEAIGQAGTVVRDLAETKQRQIQLSDLVDRFFDAAEQNQRRRKR